MERLGKTVGHYVGALGGDVMWLAAFGIGVHFETNRVGPLHHCSSGP